MSRLRPGEWLAAAASVVGLLVLWVGSWYADPARSGWNAMAVLRWPLLLVAVLGLSLAVAQATMAGPALPLVLDLLAAILAAILTVLLAVRLLTTGATLGPAAFVGVGAEAALTVGAFRAMRPERGAAPGEGRAVELVTLTDDRSS